MSLIAVSIISTNQVSDCVDDRPIESSNPQVSVTTRVGKVFLQTGTGYYEYAVACVVDRFGEKREKRAGWEGAV